MTSVNVTPDTMMSDNVTQAYPRVGPLFDFDLVMASFYVIVFSVVAILGIVGNLAVLYVMKQERNMNLPVRMIIFNQAATDVCVSAVAGPMCIAGKT